MIAQDTLFDIPTQVAQDAMLPPKPPTLVVVAEPLGECVKCGKDATVASPGGSIYCKQCGKCGGKTVTQTALGIEVKVCGTSVEEFVKHPRMGIWVCPCLFENEVI